MPINWFEGGRRIKDLLVGVVGIGCVIYVVWAGDPTIHISTNSPDDPWHFTPEECDYPDAYRYIGTYAFKAGDKRSVTLCYRANDNDLILYKEAPPPEGAPPPKVNISTIGQPPPPPMKYYFGGGPWSSEVEAYIDDRTKKFEMTWELKKQVKEGLFELGWRARWDRFKQALLVFFAFAIPMWLISYLLGWIIRGFAGIPSGYDFRPTKRKPDD